MDWISTISGIVFGGGWGTFASIALGLVAVWYFTKVMRKAKQDKAHKDTKDKEVEDHKKAIEKNQKHQKQAGKREAQFKARGVSQSRGESCSGTKDRVVRENSSSQLGCLGL